MECDEKIIRARFKNIIRGKPKFLNIELCTICGTSRTTFVFPIDDKISQCIPLCGKYIFYKCYSSDCLFQLVPAVSILRAICGMKRDMQYCDIYSFCGHSECCHTCAADSATNFIAVLISFV